jgi:hypothetical protein
VTQPRLKHFGWGREGEGLTPAEEAFVLGRIGQLFGPLAEGKVKPPRLEDIKLAPPRLDPPPSLPFCSTALYDRAAHTYGKSFPDYVMYAVWSATTATHLDSSVAQSLKTTKTIVCGIDFLSRISYSSALTHIG